MSYTTVPTFADTSMTASVLNTYIRNNQRAIKDPPSANYESNEVSDYTTTSTTFADVDTDFNLTIVTTGGDILVGFMGSGVSTGGNLLLDLSVDGTRIINTANKGIAVFPVTTVNQVSFVRYITGLSAGSHTIKLQYALAVGGTSGTIYAGAGTANHDLHPQFWVRELS